MEEILAGLLTICMMVIAYLWMSQKFEKRLTVKDAKTAVEYIKGYCGKNIDCECGCIFHEEDGCFFETDTPPCGWNMKEGE